MKKFMLLLIAVFSVVVLSGCCCGKKCAAERKCAKSARCDRPCAKNKNKKGCPLLGKWEFFVAKGDKLEALPVSPQPYMEFCKGGKLLFHYSKDGKPQVIEGRWKVANGKITVSDMSGKNVQHYTINGDSAELTIGKGDRLPENTKVVICRQKGGR